MTPAKAPGAFFPAVALTLLIVLPIGLHDYMTPDTAWIVRTAAVAPVAVSAYVLLLFVRDLVRWHRGPTS